MHSRHSLLFSSVTLVVLLARGCLTMTNKTTNENPIIIEPQILHNYYDSRDETNLVDLWLALVKQKKVFFLTTFSVIIMAMVYVTFVPATYIYKTNISIATINSAGSGAQIIQAPTSIIARLVSEVIPTVIRQNGGQANSMLNVSASIPTKTNVVLLTSKATIKQKQNIAELHQNIIELLSKSHNKKSNRMLEYLNQELSHSQAKLGKMFESLKISGANELIIMQIIDMENYIRKTKLSITQFTNTQSELGTVQSIKPTNKGSAQIIAITVLLSLFLGIFSALFANFLSKVRQ